MGPADEINTRQIVSRETIYRLFVADKKAVEKAVRKK